MMASDRKGGELSFLASKAWMDADGRHVWVAHNCVNRERVTTMLPWPSWAADGDRVSPSVLCTACGYHDFPIIESPEAEDA